jgi:hypothetical protein
MDLGELRCHLDDLAKSLASEDRRLLAARLDGLISVFPFNEYEYIISFLLDRRRISFAEYESLRTKYVSTNRYLDLYGLSPRVFGQVWGEKHLADVDRRFRKPDRSLDPNYSGEYDLWLEGVWVDRILYWVMSNEEVKADRYLSHQHRGGIEYQIGITDKNLSDFAAHQCEPASLAAVVIGKGR